MFRPSILPLSARGLLLKMKVRRVAMGDVHVESYLLVSLHQDRIAVSVLYDFAFASKEVLDGFRSVVDLRCTLCGKSASDFSEDSAIELQDSNRVDVECLCWTRASRA